MSIYVGSLLMRLGGVAYLTPTFPRGGLAALFSLEVFALTGSSLTVTVQHKNVEDTAWQTAGTFSSITAAGVFSLDVTTLKEQIRLSFVVGGTQDHHACYLNVAAPAWRPY